MKIVVAFAGFAALITAGSAAAPFGTHSVPGTARVMVHCPEGGKEAFVTPPEVRIAVGDTVEWRTTGSVITESLAISLKNDAQAWPFSGSVPRGRTSARSGRAATAGSYEYAVHLSCRRPGGGTDDVVIDPVISIA